VSSLSPRDIVAGISQIGSLPQALAAVLEVINNPQSGARDIADVISRDVSLTTRVLKLVNSANYGCGRKVSRISEAVTLMGVNSIKVVALSSSVFGMISGREVAEKQSIKRISRHLIEVAVISRGIALDIGYKEPEEAFVAGIIHDVGIIIMMLYFREKYYDIIPELNIRRKGIIATEKEIFGFDHGQVGAELIESWKLPPRLSFTVRQHHTVDTARVIDDEAFLNDLVAVADRLTLGPFEGYYPDPEENIQCIHSIAARLKIGLEDLSRIRKDAIKESIDMSKYLELDTGDLIDILADANGKLAEMFISLEKVYLKKCELEERLNKEPETTPV